MIDITEHRMRGLTISEKQHRVAAALREAGDDCAWPSDDGIVVLARDGARTLLSIADAVQRVEEQRRERPAPSHRPVEEMPSELIQEGFRKGLLRDDVLMRDSVGRMFLPINDNPEDLAWTPRPRGPRRI